MAQTMQIRQDFIFERTLNHFLYWPQSKSDKLLKRRTGFVQSRMNIKEQNGSRMNAFKSGMQVENALSCSSLLLNATFAGQFKIQINLLNLLAIKYQFLMPHGNMAQAPTVRFCQFRWR